MTIAGEAAAPALAEMPLLTHLETPCQQRLDEKREWGRTLAVRSGSVVLGVRGDTEQSVSDLETILAPLRVPDYDDRVPANYSVEIGDEGQPRRLHLIYRAHQVVARRREREALVEDLVQLLDDVPKAEAEGFLAVHAGAAVRAGTGEAILLPAEVHRILLPRRGQLEDAGLQLLAPRTQLYDAGSGELVAGLVDESASRAWQRRHGGPSPSSRFRVLLWCVDPSDGRTGELRGAQAVTALVRTVLNRERRGMATTLQDARSAVLRHRVVAMPSTTAGAQAGSLLGLLG